MAKSVLFDNAINKVIKKTGKQIAETIGSRVAKERAVDSLVDQAVKKTAPKKFSKLTNITKEAAEEVKPKSTLLNNDWAERKEAIKLTASSNKDFNQRVKKVRKKELDKVTNKNAPAKKLFPNVADSADTAQKEATKRTSKIYGDKEARKNLKFSQDGPKKLYPTGSASASSSKENKLLRNAVPTAVGGAMIFTMMNRRGQQSNSQLYGQQTPYQ